MLKRFLVVVFCLFSFNLWATDSDLPPELRSFEAFSDILPVAEEDYKIKNISRKPSIIPYIESEIPEVAGYNIANPEQVFCYHIEKRKEGDKGYTISNFNIIDYCGELDANKIATTYEALFTQGPNIITTPSSCRIVPKVMIRFVRGVDYTDVLLSSPCASFTVFYAGRYKSFNVKQGVIDDIISQFDDKRAEFNSPTLLAQTVANGVANTASDAEQLNRKKKEIQPQLKWHKNKKQEEVKIKEVPVKSGWGNIKLNM